MKIPKQKRYKTTKKHIAIHDTLHTIANLVNDFFDEFAKHLWLNVRKDKNIIYLELHDGKIDAIIDVQEVNLTDHLYWIGELSHMYNPEYLTKVFIDHYAHIAILGRLEERLSDLRYTVRHDLYRLCTELKIDLNGGDQNTVRSM